MLNINDLQIKKVFIFQKNNIAFRKLNERIG